MLEFKVFQSGSNIGHWSAAKVEIALNDDRNTSIERSGVDLVIYDEFDVWTISDYYTCGKCAHRVAGKCTVAESVYTTVSEVFTGCLGEFFAIEQEEDNYVPDGPDSIDIDQLDEYWDIY